MGTQTRSTKNRKDRESCSYRTSQEADESRAGADISYIHVFYKLTILKNQTFMVAQWKVDDKDDGT